MSRVLYLDGWRGLAILGVLFGHFFYSKGIDLGRFGVELFFVLSGRLMAEILFVRRALLETFFVRRVSRVWPALFVLCVTLYAVAWLRGSSDPSGEHTLAAVTFSINYARIWIGESDVLSHIWSLCIEEHTYMLLGLLAWLHRARPLPIPAICALLAAAGMANGAVQTLLGAGYYDVYWRTDVHSASILVSVATYLALRERVPAALASEWVPLLLAGFAFALNVALVPDPVKYSAGTLCLATSLALMHRAPARVIHWLEHPMLLRAGLYSYSIYLWQQPFLKEAHGPLERLAFLPLGLIAGLISFHFVEAPMRRTLNAAWAARSSGRKRLAG